MNVVYDERYYKNYDIGLDKPVDYQNCTLLMDFFKGVAARIVDTYNPKTLLDTGCAFGILVRELRLLGVEAYGVDISDYAVDNADPYVKPYLTVCSLAELSLPKSFPQKFDIVTNIEVMEHIDSKDAPNSIKNICELTERVLFSSTSTDFEDPTHINVNQVDVWASLFAENGFYNRVDKYPDYISPDAYCFEYCGDAVTAVKRYERYICEAKRIAEEKSRKEQEFQNAYSALAERFNSLAREYDKVRSDYAEILNSQYWRMTGPMRKITHKIKTGFKK